MKLKLTLTALAVALLAAPAGAGYGWLFFDRTFQSLPGNCEPGRYYGINNAGTEGACNGGGTEAGICVCNGAGTGYFAPSGGGGGGDDVSVDGVAATNPDFTSDGSLDAIRCTGAGAPDASCVAAEDIIYRLNSGAVDALTELADLCAANEGIFRNSGDSAWECALGAVDLIDDGDAQTATDSSESGLELVSGELGLIRGCSDAEVLKWDETNGDWDCATDDGGTGSELNTLLTHSGAQAITTSTETALAFDTETSDNGGFHDTVTNNSRITIPTGENGVYLVGCSVEWAGNATGYRSAAIRKGGSTFLSRSKWGAGVSQSAGNAVAVLDSVAVANDYYECVVAQNSGGNLNVESAETTFWIVRYKGGGAAVADIISEGNSNVEVVDTGTGQIDFDLDGVLYASMASSETVFNEQGSDINFRVEGDNSTDLINADAGLNRVGINRVPVNYELEVDGIFEITRDGNPQFLMTRRNDDPDQSWKMSVGATSFQFRDETGLANIFILTEGAPNNSFIIDASGNADVIGHVGAGDILKITPKATAPATCAVGDVYIDTSGAACFCTATNTWSNAVLTGSCA